MSIHDDASDLASTSASTGWDLPTPDLTVVSEDVGDAEEQSKKPAYAGSASAETVPVPGNTYVIRARDSGRAITVRNNELKLLEWDSASDKSSHWYCEERGGWLSFKNAVSGRYSKQASGRRAFRLSDPLCEHCVSIGVSRPLWSPSPSQSL